MNVEDYNLQQIVKPLLAWYGVHARVLPWRSNPTPYHVWLSEIMLQQTRVEAALPHYEEFLNRLPTIESLAMADEATYLKLWEGLGYYTRVRSLHKAAVLFCQNYGGTIPQDPQELKKVPGIGSYTAGAILSIAYGVREPAVDGNVLRILSRLSADSRNILDPKVKERMENLLRAMLQKEAPSFHPGDFNQALMDLGATICLPNGEPHCEACPLQPLCLAEHQGKLSSIPVRLKKTARRVEKRTVLVLQRNNTYAIAKRPAKGLLGGLFELPNVEEHLSSDAAAQYVGAMGFQVQSTQDLGEAKHVFTHLEWHMKGYRVILAPTEQSAEQSTFTFVAKEDLQKDYALPSAFRFYLKQL